MGSSHAAQRGQRVADGWLDPCSSAPDFRDWTGHTLPVRRRTDDPPLPRARAWLLRAVQHFRAADEQFVRCHHLGLHSSALDQLGSVAFRSGRWRSATER